MNASLPVNLTSLAHPLMLPPCCMMHRVICCCLIISHPFRKGIFVHTTGQTRLNSYVEGRYVWWCECGFNTSIDGRRSFNHQHSAIWLHHTCLAWSALAFRPPVNCLQYRRAGLQVSARFGAVIPDRVLFSSSRPSTATVWHHGIPLCSKNTDVHSQSPVQSHGTVYLLSCEHSICLLRRSPSDCRRISITGIDCSRQRICCTLIVSNLRWL